MAGALAVVINKGLLIFLGYLVLIGSFGFSTQMRWIVLLVLGIMFFGGKR